MHVCVCNAHVRVRVRVCVSRPIRCVVPHMEPTIQVAQVLHYVRAAVCVCACVRARARVCVCVCVCEEASKLRARNAQDKQLGIVCYIMCT